METNIQTLSDKLTSNAKAELSQRVEEKLKFLNSRMGDDLKTPELIPVTLPHDRIPKPDEKGETVVFLDIYEVYDALKQAMYGHNEADFISNRHAEFMRKVENANPDKKQPDAE